MSRDYRKLLAFQLADSLVVRLYRATASFPAEERFGIRAQLRRAAVSAATNIVEGTARRSLAEYLSFLNIATASASETRYLIDLAERLGFLTREAATDLGGGYERLVARLLSLAKSLDALERR
jgi:four helix bundle protein